MAAHFGATRTRELAAELSVFSGSEMGQVNEHYLERVVATAQTTLVEATEDILSGSGVKLIAKGGRIDANARERLLQHKLRKPLEMSVRVVDGVASRPIDRTAAELLGRHALLAGICGTHTAQVVARTMRDLRLTQQLESMLSIYAAQAPDKLEHAVGVGLLAAALIEAMPEAGAQRVHTLLLAGLMHDVGDLYIDPKILNAGHSLTPAQWRHIAAHPVVGSSVVREMPGAGPRVAEAVLFHHERLDGFGYPQGLSGSALPISGQVLGLAEVLMGIAESGRSPGVRAAVAVKLVPGEFDRRLVSRVMAAAAAAKSSDTAEGSLAAAGADDIVRRAIVTGEALQRLQSARSEIEQEVMRAAGPALRTLAGHLLDRLRRIQTAFSSTGLDAYDASTLACELEQMDACQRYEVTLVLREVEWRLRELGRELASRSLSVSNSEQALAGRVVGLFEKAMGGAHAAVGS